MKIFNTNKAPFYAKVQSNKTEDSKTKIGKSNYDQITISHTNKNSEDIFSKELSNKIMTEVRTPISNSTLDDLQSQIKNGEYKIDIDNIVKNILLDGRDN